MKYKGLFIGFLAGFLFIGVSYALAWSLYDLIGWPEYQSEPILGAVSVFKGIQGGTGYATTTAGNVGNCLSVDDNDPLIYTFSACSGGGGSGNLQADFPLVRSYGNATTTVIVTDAGLISRATSTISALLSVDDLYVLDTFGFGTATPGSAFSIRGDLVQSSGGATFLGPVKGPIFTSTSTTLISTFPIASTTSFSIADRLWVAGAGTSTFIGPLTAAGLQSTAGLEITAGGIHLASAITNTNAGTSSFTGGVSTGGLSSSNGINITAGCYSINGVCLSTGGSPAGGAGDIQYSDGSAFDAEAAFDYSESADLLTVINATTTSFSIADRLWIAGAGTSTIASGSLSLPRLGINSQVFNNLTGAGLTIVGGGLDVGAGTCITVNANDIAVTTNCTDAATVDSIEGASFLRSDTSDSFTSGTLDFSPGTALGLATSSPGSNVVLGVRGNSLFATSTHYGLVSPFLTATSTFSIYTGGGANPRFFINSSGYIGIATTSPGWPFSVAATSTFTGNFTSGMASTSANPAATLVMSWAEGNTRRVILSQATTLILNSTSSGPLDGGKYTVKACQNHIGGHTIAINSDTVRNATTAAGSNLSWISTTPNTCTFLGFLYDREYGGGLGIYTLMASSTGVISQ